MDRREEEEVVEVGATGHEDGMEETRRDEAEGELEVGERGEGGGGGSSSGSSGDDAVSSSSSSSPSSLWECHVSPLIRSDGEGF